MLSCFQSSLSPTSFHFQQTPHFREKEHFSERQMSISNKHRDISDLKWSDKRSENYSLDNLRWICPYIKNYQWFLSIKEGNLYLLLAKGSQCDFRTDIFCNILLSQLCSSDFKVKSLSELPLIGLQHLKFQRHQKPTVLFFSVAIVCTALKWTEVNVAQSCLTLCDPMDCRLPGYSVHGILQAIILEWVAMPFFRESYQPRDQTQISHIAGRFLTLWATREAKEYCSG